MYPLAVVHSTPEYDNLSPFQKKLLGKKPYRTTRKLMADFKPRLNYPVHYRNLQFYLEKGLVVTKVHSIIFYKQDYVIKPWIESNTAKRRAPRNDFERDLFKLLNNAVFGKQMKTHERGTRLRSSAKRRTSSGQ